MGSVVVLADWQARRDTVIELQDQSGQPAIDPILQAEYDAMLREAAEQEIRLCPEVSNGPRMRLSSSAKDTLGRRLDTKGVLTAAAIQLRIMIGKYGLESVKSCAEQTVYKRFLRVAVIDAPNGPGFMWRYCL